LKSHTFDNTAEITGNARTVKPTGKYQKVTFHKDSSGACPTELNGELAEMMRKKLEDDKAKEAAQSKTVVGPVDESGGDGIIVDTLT
jgi:hypothetical protein